MVQINPNRIQNQRLVKAENKNQQNEEKQKPTLQQMDDLYRNWCSFSIPYFPPSATTAILNNRREAMEKYIKENNLDIDVNNLELFFSHVKEETRNMGGLSGEQAILKMLQDYIDNGYNPDMQQGKTEPARPKTFNDNDNKSLEWKTDNQSLNLDEVLNIVNKNIQTGDNIFG